MKKSRIDIILYSQQKNYFSETYQSSFNIMLVKFTNLTLKSANINKKIQILETKYEHFNTPSKHFVGSRNLFLFLFVLIWHFNSISSHLTSISSSQ